MKQSIDNVEMLRLMEKKQKLLLKIRAALALDRMDLVKELSYAYSGGYPFSISGDIRSVPS